MFYNIFNHKCTLRVMSNFNIIPADVLADQASVDILTYNTGYHRY